MDFRWIFKTHFKHPQKTGITSSLTRTRTHAWEHQLLSKIPSNTIKHTTLMSKRFYAHKLTDVGFGRHRKTFDAGLEAQRVWSKDLRWGSDPDADLYFRVYMQCLHVRSRHKLSLVTSGAFRLTTRSSSLTDKTGSSVGSIAFVTPLTPTTSLWTSSPSTSPSGNSGDGGLHQLPWCWQCLAPGDHVSLNPCPIPPCPHTYTTIVVQPVLHFQQV